MHHISYFFSSIVSLLISFIGIINPVAGTTSQLAYESLIKEEIKLNVALISDTHIDSSLPAGKLYLSQAFQDMESTLVKMMLLLFAAVTPKSI